jgi:uncharacterized SAM-binding protein YcdF (DUF218 family)
MFRKLTVGAALAILLTGLLAAGLPRFLLYADPQEPADVIVLFLGSQTRDRDTAVKNLVRDRIADTVLIPARGKVIEGEQVQGARTLTSAPGRTLKTRDPDIDHLEGTHVEVLNARAMMEQLNASSAVFVSSPYHMRRIKIITDRVFSGSNVRITFVPSADGTIRPERWLLSAIDRQWVRQEYLKLAWFLLYEPFSGH